MINKPVNDMFECEIVVEIDRLNLLSLDLYNRGWYRYIDLINELKSKYKPYSEYTPEKLNELRIEYHLLIKERV